jgi:hypothetical protein
VLTEQPSEGGQTQELLVISGALSGFAIIRGAAYRVGCKEKFHALDVAGWCAVALVHVAATDPLRSGRHPDLITSAIIASRSPYRMSPVTIVVARFWRIVAAGVPYAVVDGIMPVVIVIGVCSVPTTIVRLERVMRPANTGIGPGHGNFLPLNPSAQTSGACV